MDMYVSNSLSIDDLLYLSDVDLTSSSSFSAAASFLRHQPLLSSPQNPFHHHHHHQPSSFSPSSSTYFNDFPPLPSVDPAVDLCIPNNDVAELEWLSQFSDNYFHDLPVTTDETVVGSCVLHSDTSFSGKANQSKRSRAARGKSRLKAAEANGGSSSSGEGSGVRRCTHCASEKTPQWRSGPLGPKTLCNACGVRYKSGRLVPEYRPAASPTFVLSQHSNSHRKVLELRRQKEMVMMKQQVQPE
ncbi:GATA transcription factor 2 [Prosopis cineraria]|uniref:GATA transcription factor 2 n=1 Tax=Prosopis cineraria TaxID=364024 RepID=UPI00240F116D|nr:GATA transcription factor 2 [Prosopis cineraria]